MWFDVNKWFKLCGRKWQVCVLEFALIDLFFDIIFGNTPQLLQGHGGPAATATTALTQKMARFCEAGLYTLLMCSASMITKLTQH
jgi:hypothetical protein